MTIRNGIDLLDRQYEYLRAEIVQCIYLRHGAIVGMYSAIAAAIGVFLAQGKELTNLASPGVVPLLAVILAFLLNAFGALYLKEQARNRRCTLLNREIEKIITRLTCKTTSTPGFLAWENHIRSSEAEGYNRLYYASTVFGVGFPIPLFTIPVAVIAQVALDPLIAGFAGQYPTLAYATCAWALFAPTMRL